MPVLQITRPLFQFSFLSSAAGGKAAAPEDREGRSAGAAGGGGPAGTAAAATTTTDRPQGFTYHIAEAATGMRLHDFVEAAGAGVN
jgi:hypothetical protein